MLFCVVYILIILQSQSIAPTIQMIIQNIVLWYNNNLTDHNTHEMDVMMSENTCIHAQAIQVVPAKTQAAQNKRGREQQTTTAQALFSNTQWDSQRLHDK